MFHIGDTVWFHGLAKGGVGHEDRHSWGVVKSTTATDRGDEEDGYEVRFTHSGHAWWYDASALEERAQHDLKTWGHVSGRSEVQRILEAVQSMKVAPTEVEIEVKHVGDLIRKGLGVDLESLVKAVPEGVPPEAWKHALLALHEALEEPNSTIYPMFAVSAYLGAITVALQAAFKAQSVVEAPTPQVVCDHGWDD